MITIVVNKLLSCCCFPCFHCIHNCCVDVYCYFMMVWVWITA